MDFLLNFAASGASTPTPEGDTTMAMVIQIVMLVAIVGVFYFFLIRPQRKRDKDVQKMRNAIEIGDEVTTIGGVVGTVVSIKDDTFVIETGTDKTKIRFLKSAISSRKELISE